MSKEVLYIGMDESNHGEDLKSRVGEIVVASFAYNRHFWGYEKHPNRRDFSQVSNALERGVGYIYTMLPHEIAKRNYSNLPLVAPFILEPILNARKVQTLKLGLDGRLRSDDKKCLIRFFEGKDLKVTITNFVKRNGVHRGPELVYLSHLIANELFHKSMLEIADDINYVPFDILKI